MKSLIGLVFFQARDNSRPAIRMSHQFKPRIDWLSGWLHGMMAMGGLALGGGFLGVAQTLDLTPGTVLGWGYNAHGQKVAPAGLNGVTAIAAGGAHTVALKSDGTVVTWGLNVSGQTTGTPTLTEPYTATANPVTLDGQVLSGVIAIAAGTVNTFALKSGGTLVAWGNNDYGQTNVPPGLEDVTAVAAGAYHVVALTSRGKVVAWGLNNSRQTNVPLDLSGVTAISACNNHTLALKNDGTVVAWGRNDGGQTIVPVGLSEVTAVAAGYFHSVALKQDGTVVAWGYNGDGETTVPAGLSGVTAIAAGERFTMALKRDGSVVVWGSNSNGQHSVPAGLGGVTAIAAGNLHCMALIGAGPADAPTITTTSTVNMLTLSWPDSAVQYRVESTSSLTPPVSWSNEAGAFQTTAGVISFALPISGAQRFYRLTNP